MAVSRKGNKGTSGALGVFDANYIGSVACRELRGNDVIQTSLDEARKINANAEMVVIIVSEDGVYVHLSVFSSADLSLSRTWF